RIRNPVWQSPEQHLTADVRVDTGRTPPQPVRVDPAAPGRQYAAALVYRHPIGKQRQFLGTDVNSGTLEISERSFKCGSDDLVEPVERQACGDAKAQLFESDRLNRPEFLSGHDRIHLGAIDDIARDRADRIESLAQRQSAIG